MGSLLRCRHCCVGRGGPHRSCERFGGHNHFCRRSTQRGKAARDPKAINFQVRASGAVLLLPESSGAIWGRDSDRPAATLLGGTGIFSTAYSNAFILHAGPAIFRAKNDEPTVGSVTLLTSKELVVRCSRGALIIAVDDDIREVPAGSAYHVVFDPNASPPPGAMPSAWGQHDTRTAGRSKFIWYAIAFVSLVTAYAISEAMESEYRP